MTIRYILVFAATLGIWVATTFLVTRLDQQDGAIAVTCAFALGLGFVYAATVRDSRALRRVRHAISALAAGRFDVPIRLARHDEIGELADATRVLSEQLAKGAASDLVNAEQWRAILDGMADAVLVTDPAGETILSNAAFTELSGTGAEGKTAVEAIRHPDFFEAFQQARDGERAETEFTLARPDGSAASVSAVLSPIRRTQSVVCVLRDVTHARAVERTRKDFVANASHELKTPLTVIKGYAETLRDGGLADQAAAGRFLSVILKHTDRLQELVGDLDALSRAESDDVQFELTGVSLADCWTDIVSGFDSRLREKELRLVTTDLSGPLALANRRAVDQVLVNLLDNAIKYSPAGGTITVAHADTETHVSIEVENTGPGIPETELDRIFERFYRRAGRSPGVDGTGLGLAIVKHLMARMRGEVRAESQLGKWTRFTVRFPRA